MGRSRIAQGDQLGALWPPRGVGGRRKREVIWVYMYMYNWLTFFFKLIYLFLAVLGLRFCARAFSSCGKRGPFFIMVHGPLTIVASLVGSTGSRHAGSVVVAHGPSCSAVCGIFLDQGSNPCPLHWQADSQPLRHQGSHLIHFFIKQKPAHHCKAIILQQKC